VTDAKPLRVAVLISGGGRSLENLAESIVSGNVPAEIVDVISSHPDVFGLERARRLGFPHHTVDFRSEVDNFSDSITAAVDACRADLVVMAGFIRKWEFPSRFEMRVLNIHPALLPAFGGKGFYGGRVHQAVIDSGAKFSGCTVHFANLEYDRGPIILQRVIPVLADDTADTLAARVFEQECLAYPEAIRCIAEERLEFREGRVLVRE
jgi:formyltetrahydrofolate-dependent phosphoribosylglycinamide formyltransferase